MAPLFSYGTLQLDSVQRAQFGRLLEGSDDVLHGFAIIEIQIRDPHVLEASGIETHLALVPGDGPPIAGKVFQLTEAELAAADVYESENYRRDWVPLASGNHAWVYVKA
ncbi:gamma-glutamylcyclotransferase family protein [Sphingomonas hengshuiensis]|uniref:UDP-N-acetylmuramate--alanine ligase n=1 Tax=Sphingomonas hengshuiensis TaxID=1609977 RepID=A0A7U4J976_9SPHN|nr:gamma-glutamylcyclotransferase family protein [Sphingomonas hengshuiensis]AJP72566.1 UDP-N-acetylmuramate--alanine ligase [Sphingomonas hengshuiensis]